MHITFYKNIYFFITILGLSAIAITNAQSNNVARPPDEANLEEFQHGKLPNGFSYYIKPLEKNTEKIYLNFFVKVGSSQEEKLQNDIAHVVEHMVLKGTPNFPNGIKDYERFEGKGVVIGNISAGFRHTEYNLIVPTNDEQALNTAFLLYKDLLTEAFFRNSDLDFERGVLEQEYILRNVQKSEKDFLKYELMSQIFPCRSKVSESLSSYKNLQADSLRAFYHKWYRPGLSTLIISGDIGDDSNIKKKIEGFFSEIKNGSNSPNLRNCDSLYLNQANKFIVLGNDSKVQLENEESVQFQLIYRDKKVQNRISPYEKAQDKLLWKIIIRVLNKRFDDASSTYNTKPYTLFSRHSDKNFPSLKLELNAQQGQEIIALNELVYSLKQLKEFGFHKNEWQLARKKIKEEMEKKDFSKSFFWQNQVVAHKIYGEELKVEKLLDEIKWLSSIRLDEVNEKIKSMVSDFPEDIGIIAPSKSKAYNLSEKEVRSEIRKSINRPIKQYNAPSTPKALMKTENVQTLKPIKGLPGKKGKYGTKIYELQNGATIILKNYNPANDYKQDKIILHGFRKGGAAYFSGNSYFSAVNAPKIVRHAGVGEFDKFQLDRFLKNTSFWQGAYPYINYDETGIKGSSKPQDFETLLQLVYLYFTQPRKDTTAFLHWKRTQKNFYQNLPRNRFHSDLTDDIADFFQDRRTNYSGYRALEGIDSTEIDQAYKIYNDLFSNASEFTFIITGQFNEERNIQLLNKYLGNLPGHGKIIEEQEDEKIEYPKGPIYKEFETPLPHSNIKYIAKFIDQEPNEINAWKEDILLRILGQLTHQKIYNMRYTDKFAIYSSSAYTKSKPKSGLREVIVDIACSPSELDAIRKTSWKFYSDVKKGGFSEREFQNAKKNVSAYYSKNYMNKNIQTNEYLYKIYRNNESHLRSHKVLDFIGSVTKKELVEAAKRFYQDRNKYEFILKENNL